ncbi:MAG: regulatory protein RecX, partial [Candidatus Kryptoniota bacterium]
MRIVSIEKARRGGKLKALLDDGNELLLSKEVIIDHGLRRNDEISDENLHKIQDSQLYHDTYFAAMRLINYRMRTKSELIQRLGEKKFPGEMIERVVEKLNGIGLIDDQKFAELFIAGKVAQRPVGKRELERKLREKGISKDMASRALSVISGDDFQNGLASQAAEVKGRSLKRFD